MLEQLLNKFITSQGSKLKMDEEKIAVANYGLQIIVYSTIGVILIFFIASLLGAVKAVFAAFITAALLRTFSGGAHCKGPLKCMSITCMVFPLLGVISVNISASAAAYSYYTAGIIFLFALLSFYKFAPVDCANKPITCPLQKKQLRLVSFSLITIFLFLSIVFQYRYYEIVLAGQLGILWQSLTLWPLSIKITQRYDQLLAKN
ncbi:accessory gene regulator ArgB-like protein [Desulfitibacter alkalitolerans]|uniref:accessory gene regulator ArgB-like protein n=1 Tax=Desulfitibacter alkalitolerans TaxID=264641 RepID=UPI00048A2D18|nr:accessory gene regulator B family protein [Desulfitibacter alkalitolerans]